MIGERGRGKRWYGGDQDWGGGESRSDRKGVEEEPLLETLIVTPHLVDQVPSEGVEMLVEA